MREYEKNQPLKLMSPDLIDLWSSIFSVWGLVKGAKDGNGFGEQFLEKFVSPAAPAGRQRRWGSRALEEDQSPRRRKRNDT